MSKTIFLATKNGRDFEFHDSSFSYNSIDSMFVLKTKRFISYYPRENIQCISEEIEPYEDKTESELKEQVGKPLKDERNENKN